MTEPVAAINPDFTYWNSVDPSTFLDHDWANPSRQWACEAAISAARTANGAITAYTVATLLEVGPGPGVDYERHFRKHVLADTLAYRGVEGSETLYDALQSRFPEATWQCATIADLSPLSADVVYARHVMEHQPSLEPALGQVLGAARHVVVLTWYRPPAAQASAESWQGLKCHTYARADVLAAIGKAGFRVAASESFASGDEAWVLERR